jgi:hypothetical protein
MSQDLDTVLTYYVGRLITEYQKPNAQATIAILCKQMLADGLPWSLQDAYNLPTAIGAQLNTLGKYIGISRMIGDAAPLPFFGMVRYAGGGNQNGVTKYATTDNANVVFYRYGYNGANATALSDTAYAYMLLYKIALNQSDSTLYSIQQTLIATLAGNVRVRDNLDMTLTYFVGTNIPVSPTVLTPFLPKPMGVGIAAVVVQSNIITGTGDTVVSGTGDNIVAGNA